MQKMPKFSQQSFSKLSTCHLDLQTLFYEVVRTFDCTVIEGHRNEEDQNIAYADGNSKLQWPNGKHNSQPSNAVDVAPFPIDWQNTLRFYWFAGYVLGVASRLKEENKISHAIRWGGNWEGGTILNRQQLYDLVHFELIL
jgi:peptidoglycan L-alanyl-D-glutamate endopeptidase CwlK